MNNIIFIEESESYIVRSISNKLEEKGFSCTTISWEVDEINKNADLEDIVIAYVEDESEIPVNALKYLRDMTISKRYRLFFAGHDDEIDAIVEKHSFSDVTGRFCRPINVVDVADKIVAVINSDPMLERKHILVVDDSGVMLNTIQEWLGDDYRVSIVNSAMNAIAFLNKNIPDLILLDYEMPGCSGPQLFEMIRADAHTKKIPVIFLTGKDDAESVQRVLALKPSGYILKTMPKNYIIEQVHIFFSKLRDQLV
ncbi:MAG: response regulator [Lachnospiraceae bacterium]|nr:response regulator [Lachnospiraceae bacterium]